MAKYRKKPVVIDAYHFTKQNYHRGLMPDWLKEAINSEKIILWSQYSGEIIEGEIKTLEGKMKVSENDFIIKGINGEFYPCKPNIFAKTYDKVNEGEQPFNFPELSTMGIKDGDIIHCEFEDCPLDEVENILTCLKGLLAKAGYPNTCILANQKGDLNISVLDEEAMRKLGWVRAVAE